MHQLLPLLHHLPIQTCNFGTSYNYEGKKDEWTSEKADKEVFKFHDVLVNGKIGLAVVVATNVRKITDLAVVGEREHRVVSIEWSGVAIKQFFEENGLSYSTKSCRIGGIDMPVYTADDKTITIILW